MKAVSSYIFERTANCQLDAAGCGVRPAIQTDVYEAGVFSSIVFLDCRKPHVPVVLQREELHLVAVLRKEAKTL